MKLLSAALMTLTLTAPAHAHYGPDVSQADATGLSLVQTCSFNHPLVFLRTVRLQPTAEEVIHPAVEGVAIGIALQAVHKVVNGRFIAGEFQAGGDPSKGFRREFTSIKEGDRRQLLAPASPDRFHLSASVSKPVRHREFFNR